MKAWPIDPLFLENFKIEVSEKLPQGLTTLRIINQSQGDVSPVSPSLTAGMEGRNAPHSYIPERKGTTPAG